MIKSVIAHWGIAYAIGPNYNKPWEAFEEDEKPECLDLALASISNANSLKDKTSAFEQGLIAAINTRYAKGSVDTDSEGWNNAYADAMRKLYQSHQDDLDITCLFAEAIMNRTPWQMWDLPSGKPVDGADTEEAIAVLDKAFETIEGAWSHPGLLHMYIHLMEMSPHPERALRHGDALSTLVPDAGHLLHMPTHIDVLCGEYQDVVSRNQMAIQADKNEVAGSGGENFYAVYRAHNYHFKIYGAMFLGQPSVALETAEELTSVISEDFLRTMADWFEGFIPMKQHVLIRFGRWKEILEQKIPDDQELYCVTTAMMRYARTVALSNLGKLSEAEIEKDQFYVALEKVPNTRMIFNNTCRDILMVAEQMMLGELAYHKGDFDAAFTHLRNSVDVDDNLPYDEPWGWMQPTRHALGALLIEQGHYEEAETVYRADLGLDSTLSRACQHPANVWSLHGLHECLVKRGEKVEVKQVKLQLDKAAARAEMPIKASCYCRQVA